MALSAEPAASADPAIAASDPAKASKGSAEVAVRILSSLILATVLIACLYFGWPFFHLLVFATAGLMAWEWSKLCGRGAVGPGGLVLVMACPAVVALASFGLNNEASLVLILASSVVGLSARAGRPADAVWLGFGVFYVGGATFAAVALFDLFQHGMWAVVWIFAVVAFTDIGAFLAGRSIGGPKLAPRLSPKKTWSGFFGGLACAALAGLVFALFIDRAAAGFHMGAALLISLLAQGGDIFESLVKRRFGAKDSGTLIPGHGGLLDRVDGIVPAMIFVAIAAWLRGGTGTPWL